jgi:hypothetical protein
VQTTNHAIIFEFLGSFFLFRSLPGFKSEATSFS